VDKRHTGFFVFAFYRGEQTYLASDNFTIVQIIPATKCYNRYSVSHTPLFDENLKRRSGVAAAHQESFSPSALPVPSRLFSGMVELALQNRSNERHKSNIIWVVS
jgi:hypothetical protein